jgi:hypothetical protein
MEHAALEGTIGADHDLVVVARAGILIDDDAKTRAWIAFRTGRSNRTPFSDRTGRPNRSGNANFAFRALRAGWS